jgi:hypothetical protein
MSDSRTDLEKGAPTVPPSALTSPGSEAGHPAASSSAPRPSNPETNAETAQLADNLAQQLLECQALSTAWLVKAGQILNEHQRQLPHGDMTAIHNSGRLPWGHRYCQVLALLGRNPALSDPKLLAMLPSSISALEVIAANLDATLIQEGLRSRTLHPRLTRKTALAAARKLRREALLKNPTLPLP